MTRFGSAGRRSETQKIDAKREFTLRLASTPDSIHVFTDGACAGNPGKAGSGVCIIVPSHLRSDGRGDDGEIQMHGWQGVGIATNNVAELNAILIFLKMFASPTSGKFATRVDWNRVKSIELFSDSKYCVGLFTKNWSPSTNVELIDAIKSNLSEFSGKFGGTRLNLQWIPGHVDLVGNEMADTLANRGRDIRATGATPIQTTIIYQ